jgi:hypothetical protein
MCIRSASFNKIFLLRYDEEFKYYMTLACRTTFCNFPLPTVLEKSSSPISESDKISCMPYFQPSSSLRIVGIYPQRIQLRRSRCQEQSQTAVVPLWCQQSQGLKSTDCVSGINITTSHKNKIPRSHNASLDYFLFAMKQTLTTSLDEVLESSRDLNTAYSFIVAWSPVLNHRPSSAS